MWNWSTSQTPGVRRTLSSSPNSKRQSTWLSDQQLSNLGRNCLAIYNLLTQTRKIDGTTTRVTAFSLTLMPTVYFQKDGRRRMASPGLGIILFRETFVALKKMQTRNERDKIKKKKIGHVCNWHKIIQECRWFGYDRSMFSCRLTFYDLVVSFYVKVKVARIFNSLIIVCHCENLFAGILWLWLVTRMVKPPAAASIARTTPGNQWWTLRTTSTTMKTSSTR